MGRLIDTIFLAGMYMVIGFTIGVLAVFVWGL